MFATRLQVYRSHILDLLLRAAVVAVVSTVGALVDLDLFANLAPANFASCIWFSSRPSTYVLRGVVGEETLEVRGRHGGAA